MLKDSLPAKDVKINNILKGDYTLLTFTVLAQKILIKCIYAPDKDMTYYNYNDTNDNCEDSNNKYSNTFWRTVMDDSDDHEFDVQLTVGDFNVASKHEQDTAGYLHINNPNMRDFLARMIP